MFVQGANNNLAPGTENTKTIDANVTGFAYKVSHSDIYSDARFDRFTSLLAEYLEKYADRAMDAIESDNVDNN